MKEVRITFSDQRCREIEYFLRKRYDTASDCGIVALIEQAIAHEVLAESKKDVEEAEKHYQVAQVIDEIRHNNGIPR